MYCVIKHEVYIVFVYRFKVFAEVQEEMYPDICCMC